MIGLLVKKMQKPNVLMIFLKSKLISEKINIRKFNNIIKKHIVTISDLLLFFYGRIGLILKEIKFFII